MPQYSTLPLPDAGESRVFYEVNLDGTDYILFFDYCERSQYYLFSMTLADTQEPVVQGLPMLFGRDLLRNTKAAEAPRLAMFVLSHILEDPTPDNIDNFTLWLERE